MIFAGNFQGTSSSTVGNQPKRPPLVSDSEVITIIVLFYFGGFRNLKCFYIDGVQKHMQEDLPRTVSYNRFVELARKVCMPMTLFLRTCCLGECTGISFVDSAPIRACNNKRIKRESTTFMRCSMV